MCEDVLVPRGGLSLHAQGYISVVLGRTQLQSPWYLRLSISICVLFLMFSFVWLGLVPVFVSLPPSFPPSLEVGPWVGPLPFVAVPWGRPYRPPSGGALLLWLRVPWRVPQVIVGEGQGW